VILRGQFLVCGFERLQSFDVQHELPALEFWNFAERRHATFGVSVGDLPKQRAVTLSLNNRQLEIGRVLDFYSSALAPVTLDAVATEKFFPSSR